MSTIFITGTSSGIGRATAKLFAQNGWSVIAAMRHPERDTELPALPNIRTVALDITDPRQVRDVVADVVRGGQVDVVFNNAGAGLVGPLEGTTDQQIVAQVTTNLLGPIRVTQAFVPSFRDRRSGMFINTTSLASLVATPFMSVYSATKAGLERWSFAMNLELNGFGIRVKTIIPGIVKTSFSANADVASSAPYAEPMDKLMSALGNPAALPMAREPDDIATVVWQAATDGTDQIRYLADEFAQASAAGIVRYGEHAVQNASSQQLFK